MKTNFSKILSMAMLAFALCAQGTSAWAGAVGRPQVSIGYRGSTPVSAFGTLTGARYSPDDVQFIGCNIESLSSSAGPEVIVICTAKTKKGTSLSCSTYDARFADALKGMTDSSFISFSVVGGQECTNLEITNASQFLR